MGMWGMAIICCWDVVSQSTNGDYPEPLQFFCLLVLNMYVLFQR